MQIQKIQLLPQIVNYNFNNKKSDNIESKTEYKRNLSLNYAYRDYNINFGDRLYRTPENFYEQSFNKNGMPNTMKEYLYADYEDRKHMPPFQMLQYVFDDLNRIDNLDYVKRLYPAKEEPLFANLTNEPAKQARKGLLYEYQALKDEMDDIPLFKDGKSNLGMYFLRKIYVEGKTLKEIQEDFKSDINSEYRDLITSNVDYEDIHAFGIVFPKQAFWKSFTANRETYPYVYKPRKADAAREANGRERTLADILHNNPEDYIPPKPKNRFKVKDDDEGKRMGDAIISGHGNDKLTKKSLRHKGIVDDEELSFVSKYLSQIMSVALEKTHASEEMRNFFESYDSLNKRQKEKMESYWRSNPQMREFQSLAISDTIKLFFEAYGVDGNNDEFRELIEYANSIKPAREARDLEHNKLQAEYDELFANIDDSSVNETLAEEVDVSPKKELTEEEFNAMLEKEAIKNGSRVKVFFDPETGNDYRFVFNLEECIEDEYKRLYKLMPEGFVKRYMNFLKKTPLATERYLESAALINQVPEFAQNQLMSPAECYAISEKINEEFNKKHSRIVGAAETALAMMLIKQLNYTREQLLVFNADQLSRFALNSLKIETWTAEERKELDTLYKDYLEPVKSRDEVNNLTQLIADILTSVSPESPEWSKLNVMDDVDTLMVANMLKYPKLKAKLIKDLKYTKFLENYNGTPKLLYDQNLSLNAKLLKTKIILEDFMHLHPDTIIEIVSADKDNILKYVQSPQIRSKLLNMYYQNK